MSPRRPPEEITVGRVFHLWLPLAASFQLMITEGPALQAAVGRLAFPQLNLAAWGLTIGLSLLIESPVIMLLSTSIALVSDGPAMRALRRFMLALCVGCTTLTALVAFTPLYDFVTWTLMRQPLDIRTAARPALQIMLLWSAAIGYRRFYHGVLVRWGYARRVTVGTALRLVTMATAAVILVRSAVLTGVETAAAAIMSGVIVESLVTRMFARRAVHEVLRHPEPEQALTWSKIVGFHAPLAATTLMALLVEPLNAAALAWLPNADVTLAAWPVAFTTVFIIRGLSFPLQESAVTLAAQPGAMPAMRRFTLLIGLGSCVLLALLAFTPLLRFYLTTLLETPLNLEPYIQVAVAICIIQPLFTSLGALNRGTLMAFHQTADVYGGMILSLVAQVVLLTAMVMARVPGMWMAAISSVGSVAVEFLWLRSRVAIHVPKDPVVAGPN
jgi:hypothetical protein